MPLPKGGSKRHPGRHWAKPRRQLEGGEPSLCSALVRPCLQCCAQVASPGRERHGHPGESPSVPRPPQHPPAPPLGSQCPTVLTRRCPGNGPSAAATVCLQHRVVVGSRRAALQSAKTPSTAFLGPLEPQSVCYLRLLVSSAGWAS